MRHLLSILFAFTLLHPNYCSAQEPHWKLRPLKYNNPGLRVDLGVGLWAWPMPMDYDGDGDLDLLVSCPDKPSNGVYFFENPSQDAAEKTPVFKPGVRVGKTSSNFQVSYVAGQPRILHTCFEFPRDEKTGAFDFARGKRIYPKNNVHENRVRANMWRYVDFEGDGDQDLVVGAGDWTDYGWDHAYDSHGRWRNGRLHGYVYLIVNDGSDQRPQYSAQPRKLTAGGGVIDVYGWPSPNFADFDDDGDLDLYVANDFGENGYYRNDGAVFVDAAGELGLSDPGNGMGASFGDFDNDGHLDLHVTNMSSTAGNRILQRLFPDAATQMDQTRVLNKL
ncbi:MAG: VCBS repeat-containing protein, partial [Pirellulaceae bacterium]|nr:VCBS repeat-containing protein [Pirellulaceae bacterium]